MERDLNNVWLCGIHDPAKNYGMLLHAGSEEEVRMTYNAMTRGAKSSGLNTQCLKLLSPDIWRSLIARNNVGSVNDLFESLLNGTLKFDRLFK